MYHRRIAGSRYCVRDMLCGRNGIFRIWRHQARKQLTISVDRHVVPQRSIDSSMFQLPFSLFKLQFKTSKFDSKKTRIYVSFPSSTNIEKNSLPANRKAKWIHTRKIQPLKAPHYTLTRRMELARRAGTHKLMRTPWIEGEMRLSLVSRISKYMKL